MYIEFISGEKHASKSAAISDNHESFKDCGYLLEDDDVVIDIDCLSKDTISALIRYFNINTKTVWTNRGVHLYYKKPSNFNKAFNGVCSLGFKIEMKTKSNTPRGLTIKQNGTLRIIDNADNVEVLPNLFNMRKNFSNLLGIGEGEGRNDALFKHRKMLNQCDNWERILQFVNNYIFDKPLEIKEFQSIVRDMPLDVGAFNQNQMCELVINDAKCCIYKGDIWYMKNDKYITDRKNERLIRDVYAKCPDKDSRYVEEVIKQISMKAPLIYDTKEGFAIRTQNGVLKDGKWIEIEYEDFTPYYIDIHYDPDCVPVKMVDDYIDQLTKNDKDYRRMFLQSLGLSLITNKERVKALGKFFMFRGDGANGKGTLLTIIRNILGDINCTSMSIKQLTDPRYASTLIGKLANLGDDIEAEAINTEQMKILKNISTADDISIRKLYKEAENGTTTATMYFTTNSDNKSYEKGYAYQRRVIWMPMFTKVEKVDPNFISKITTQEALEYWLKLIVDGYIDLYSNGWHYCQIIEDFNNEYHESNNVMKLFLKDYNVESDIVGRTINEIKTLFQEWNDDETQKYSSKLLKDALNEYGIIIKVVKRNGKSQRIAMPSA